MKKILHQWGWGWGPPRTDDDDTGLSLRFDNLDLLPVLCFPCEDATRFIRLSNLKGSQDLGFRSSGSNAPDSLLFILELHAGSSVRSPLSVPHSHGSGLVCVGCKDAQPLFVLTVYRSFFPPCTVRSPESFYSTLDPQNKLGRRIYCSKGLMLPLSKGDFCGTNKILHYGP